MYTDKTVLITGTSKGIGYSLTEHFLKNHATVIGLSRRKEGPVGVDIWPCDLERPDAISDTFLFIQQQYSKIDILINNAAVLTSQYFLKMFTDDIERMVKTDFLAPFIVTKECMKLMKKSDSGRIVNISSMAVALEPMGDSVYAACKSGLNKMSNIMAKEFAFMDITVNTLAISAIETDMLKQLNKEKIDKVVAGLPIPRYATIEDITNVIDFYCSEKSSYITGQTIYLGGVHN